MSAHLKKGGFTPKGAAAAIAVDALVLAINHPKYYSLDEEPTAYRRAVLKQAHKLAIKLMEQHQLDGVVPDPKE